MISHACTHEAREGDDVVQAIKIIAHDGEHHVEVSLVVDGLATHPFHNRRERGWTITHIKSGMNLASAGCAFERREQAEAAARDIAKITDWTKDGKTVVKTNGLQPMVASVAARHGGARA